MIKTLSVIFTWVGLVFYFCPTFSQQSLTTYCGTTDPSPGDSALPAVSQLVNTSMQIAVIYVDFPDGRKSDGTAPVSDADTSLFPGDAINAVGSMGWVHSTLDPNSPLRKKIRKYEYEDYWNMLFSVGIYYDDSTQNYHPSKDWSSSGAVVYGSVRDYYREVSYNQFDILPAFTRSGSQDMYHTGIINRIDVSNGKNYIHWIQMPYAKSHYLNQGGDILGDAITVLDVKHSLPTNDPEYIEFNRGAFSGKIQVVGAGSNVGGYTNEMYSFTVYSTSEKWYYTPNSLSTSTFDGVLPSIHEFGHTLGLSHVTIGSFDPMHYGGLAGNFTYCPPHFNALTKINFGWIPAANIAKIRNTATGVSLRPVELAPSGSQPSVALVSIYGDAGRNNNYAPGEFFVVEYRTRSGFNRFTGGGNLAAGSTFTGGALVWQYSSLTLFPYVDIHGNGQQPQGYLSLEVPGYSAYYQFGKDQAPTDYFTVGSALDTNSSYPNSRSRGNINTGIAINTFNFSNGNLNFSVQYRLGSQPVYDFYCMDATAPAALSGNVYVENMAIPTRVTVSPGTRFYIVPNRTLGFSTAGVTADASGSDSIVCDVVGYGPFHEKWKGVYISGGPTASVIKNWVIKNASVGLTVGATNAGGIYPVPIAQLNKLYGNDTDLVLAGRRDLSNIPDISGFDMNSFHSLGIYDKWKLNNANSFVIPSGVTTTWKVTLRGDPTTDFNQLIISAGKTFQANGPLMPIGDLNINGGTSILNSSLAITAGAKLSLTGGAALRIGPSATFSSGSGSKFSVGAGSTVSFGQDAQMTLSGSLSAIGTASQPITFTSSEPSPWAGAWSGIVLSGEGPDTVTYCNIKYGDQGLRLNTCANGSLVDHDTISNCYNNGISVTSTSTGSTNLKIIKSLVHKSTLRGLRVGNARVNVYSSRIDSCNGDAGVSVANAAYVSFDSCRVQGNLLRGIDVTGSGSRASLSINENAVGMNTLANNGGELLVRSSATAFLGYTSTTNTCVCDGGTPAPKKDPLPGLSSVCPPGCIQQPVYTRYGGYNNVYDNATYSGHLVADSTTTTVNAEYTWWGTQQTNRFVGTVNAANPLTGAINTPSKTAYRPGDIVHGAQGEKTEGARTRLEIIGWLQQMKDEVLADGPLALDGLYQIASYVGGAEGDGAYRSALDLPLDGFLTLVEATAKKPELRNLALALHIQQGLNEGRYEQAIAMANTALHLYDREDDLWLYLQARKVYALTALGHKADARNLFASTRDRALRIDSTSTQDLADFLADAPENMAGAGVVDHAQQGLLPRSEELKANMPKRISLGQNYPNPFNPTTAINYELPFDAEVELRVYSMLGQEVATLVNANEAAGYHSAMFNASNVASGVYFYRFHATPLANSEQGNAFMRIMKMVLLK